MKRATFDDYRERIRRVLRFIAENLNEELSGEQLAELACFSRFHFSRVFRGMVGEGLTSLIRRLRLERAAFGLREGKGSVTQLSLEAGFENLESFSRAFKASFGTPPSVFAQTEAPNPRIRSPNGIHWDPGGTPMDFKTPQEVGSGVGVRILRRPTVSIAFVSHRGAYDKCGEAWDRLLEILGVEGWLGGDVDFFGVCYDNPEDVPEEELRYDACAAVPRNFPSYEGIDLGKLTGGLYAVTTHFGAYSQLGESWTRLFGSWLPWSGFEPGDSPCFEQYFNSPESCSEEDLCTDLFLPLMEKANPSCFESTE
jgi:AraC family transcriptional regulator